MSWSASGLGRWDELAAMLPPTRTHFDGWETLVDAIEAARPAWHTEALCRGMMVDGRTVFFPGRGENADTQTARSICQGCPVKAECLEAGMMEKHGVWGGTSERQRRQLRRFRRKADAAFSQLRAS